MRSSFNFDNELEKLQQLSKIKKKLKKTGTNPETLLRIRSKRTWLDKLSIPKKIRVKTPCFKMKVSFLFCIFVMSIIDFFILFKYVLEFRESRAYPVDFPQIVLFQIWFKGLLLLALVILEGFGILYKHMFSICKVAYFLKVIEIFFVFYEAFRDKDKLVEQCTTWLKNPAYHLMRPKDKSSDKRPLTVVFNCNYSRVMEDKTVKDTAD